jgi:hypothetical protein
MKTLAALLLACLAAGTVLAQERQRPPHKWQMKQEERQRLREDMRDVSRGDVNRGQHQDRQRQMTPQQRDRLRRDVHEASKDMKR